MAEDWNAIAAEVASALASVGDLFQPNGFSATLRIGGSGAPANLWDPPGGDPTHAELVVVQDTREMRNFNGKLIGQTVRTQMCNATGVVPRDDMMNAVGVAVSDVTDATVFKEILAVRLLAPAGVALLYEIDLST